MLFDIPYTLREGKMAIFAIILKIQICHLNQFTMPTYMHACMHAHTHTRMHACPHTCMHACPHTYMHACPHTYMHACMHACMHAHIHACMHTCSMPTYMQACMHASMPTYIHERLSGDDSLYALSYITWVWGPFHILCALANVNCESRCWFVVHGAHP